MMKIIVTGKEVYTIEDIDDLLGITIDNQVLEFIKGYIKEEKEKSYSEGLEDSDLQDEVLFLEEELENEKHQYEELYDEVEEVIKKFIDKYGF